MAIRALAQRNFVKWIYPKRSWARPSVSIDFSMLKNVKDDTFIAIFSPGSEAALMKFEAEKDKYKLLFRNEKKAINKVHYGTGRNTVVVFELKNSFKKTLV